MSAELTDYRVLSVVTKGPQGCSYCVEEKSTGRHFIWEPVDYGLFTYDGKSILLDEIRKLLTVNHQHLIQCSKYVDQPTTGTLYLVKENCGGSLSSFIKKCQTTKSFIDENFLWKIMYQIARAAQAMYTRGPSSVLLDISATGVHLDEKGDVKLDYWLAFREADLERRRRRNGGSSKDGSDRKQKKSDSMALGQLVQALATLQPSKSLSLPQHYSQQLQEIVDLMIQPDQDKRPSIESILYHPSLMSQVVTQSVQQMTLNTKEQTNVISTSNDTPCARCKELESKLAVMRTREANIKARETDLKERERTIAQRAKHISMMELLAEEKLNKVKVSLDKTKECNVNSRPPVDLDSSCYSADPDDMYQLPTVAKLDPSRIVRLPSLAPSVCSRRSVRFETIQEEINTRRQSSQQKWLDTKRMRYKAAKAKSKVHKPQYRASDKENVPPEPEKINTSIVSLPHNTKESCNGLLETFFR